MVAMSMLSDLMRFPTVGKFLLKQWKKNALNPLKLPREKIMERQETLLKKKIGAVERTDIGKKLGIKEGSGIKDLPLTSYEFYQPFFNNPVPSAFMYPLDKYRRTMTSATSGAPKWFMTPSKKIEEIRKTMFTSFMVFSHDGEKFQMEYGDTVYINVAPQPYAGGLVLSEEDRVPTVLNIVPNLHLPYRDKVDYFIRNYEKIDSAATLAASLVSQIMPVVKKPLKLKGLGVFDTVVAETYYEEIEEFAGTPPRIVYTSTETLLPSLPSIEHRLSFIMDWRCGFFEFIPLHGDGEREQVLDVSDVEAGGVYRVVYTSFQDELTRYDTKDSFECIALSDDVLGIESPVFKFHSRVDKVIDIQRFTRIDESELLQAFKDADIPLVDFTARKEIVEGLEYLTIYLEHSGDENASTIHRKLHEALYRIDKDYANLTEFFEYTPLRVVQMPSGTFMRYLEQKEAAVPKVERIDMDQKNFSILKELLNSNASSQ
jgi:hypothetical protein